MAGFSISAAPTGSRAESASPESLIGQTKGQEQQISHAQSESQPGKLGDTSPNMHWNEMTANRTFSNPQAQLMLNDGFALYYDSTSEKGILQVGSKSYPSDQLLAGNPISDAWSAAKGAADYAHGQGNRLFREATKDGAILDAPLHPYIGQEDTQTDYNACMKAWKSFPALMRHPNLDPALEPAIIRNEVRHLRQDDKYVWNPFAQYSVGLEKDRTIGPGNISTRNIDSLVAKYPQLTDPELGGIDPKHPYRDALDPKKAAWLVAAYLADATEQLEQSGHKTVTNHDLLKSYNPGADQKSQFDFVHKEMMYVKEHHPLFADDK